MSELIFIDMDDSFLNFASDLQHALDILRPNNGLLDSFTWNKNCLMPLHFENANVKENFLVQSSVLGLNSQETQWVDGIMEYEFYQSRDMMLNLDINIDSILEMNAFDFITQRYKFLARENMFEARTLLTQKEILILEFQFQEFKSHFEISNDVCKCEERSLINWITRVINIILQKSMIIDKDFVKINETFEYYKSVNIFEVIGFLNMIDNNHDFQKKYYFDTI